MAESDRVKKRYVHIAEASKVSGYTDEYIERLCRLGKIPCRLMGEKKIVELDALLRETGAILLEGEHVGFIEVDDESVYPPIVNIGGAAVAVPLPSLAEDEGPHLGSIAIVGETVRSGADNQLKTKPARSATSARQGVPLFSDIREPENTDVAHTESRVRISVSGGEQWKLRPKIVEVSAPAAANVAAPVQTPVHIPVMAPTPIKVAEPVPVAAPVSIFMPNIIPVPAAPIIKETPTPLPVAEKIPVTPPSAPIVSPVPLTPFLPPLTKPVVVAASTPPSEKALPSLTPPTTLEIYESKIPALFQPKTLMGKTALVALAALLLVAPTSLGIGSTLSSSLSESSAWMGTQAHGLAAAVGFVKPFDVPEDTFPYLKDTSVLLSATAASESGNTSQGVVVTGSTGSASGDAALKQTITNSFSDQVQVVPNADGKSGVIRPVFRQGPGASYIYVMVPVSN